jgi:hypothetical protein
MSRHDPLLKIGWQAQDFLKELGIASLPVNPFEIAERLDISLMAMPSSQGGPSGMLIHVDGQFGIGYPTQIESEGFKRFSVAHELGHFRLPGHMDAVLDPSGKHISQAGFINQNQYEIEADHFAASLLMPTNLFSREVEGTDPDFIGIQKLADLCVTSLEATAIRFAQCSRNPSAIIRSEKGTIDYCFMSRSLKDFPGIEYIRRGSALSHDTVTYRFNSHPEKVRYSARESGVSRLQDWFGGQERQRISEEVVGLGRYGKTLTLLTDIDLPEDDFADEEAEDRELTESWTPRFRR